MLKQLETNWRERRTDRKVVVVVVGGGGLGICGLCTFGGVVLGVLGTVTYVCNLLYICICLYMIRETRKDLLRGK